MKKTLKIGLLGLLTSFGVGFSGCDYKGIEEKIEAPQASVVKKENRKSRIAFVSRRDGNHEIYTMNPDGTDVRRLTNNNAQDLYPSWSPDGRKIVFSSDRDDNSVTDINRKKYEIYIMNSDGSEQKRLTCDAFDNKSPSISPDNTKIAFLSFNSKEDFNIEKYRYPGLYLMNMDGSEIKEVGKEIKPIMYGTLRHYSKPIWTLNGNEIIYVEDRNNIVYGLYSINIDGSNKRSISNNSVINQNGIDQMVESKDFYPSLSPDNKRIAFSSNRNEDPEIYVMDFDGSRQQRLTCNPCIDKRPSWSPDGKKIVFESDRDGNYEIYIMNSDGSEQADLTNNKDWDWMPSWSPFLNNPID